MKTSLEDTWSPERSETWREVLRRSKRSSYYSSIRGVLPLSVETVIELINNALEEAATLAKNTPNAEYAAELIKKLKV
jgi:hypothetical protein